MRLAHVEQLPAVAELRGADAAFHGWQAVYERPYERDWCRASMARLERFGSVMPSPVAVSIDFDEPRASSPAPEAIRRRA
jgi:hypothetical protein